MRQKIIAGNWKMNMTSSQTTKFCEEIKKKLPKTEAKVILCPPFTSIGCATLTLNDSPISVGAQNMYFEDHGPYTGEISAQMLKELGVEYVILGHSDRREIFGESDELINNKIKKALQSGLVPILCFGENLDQKKEGKTKEVITSQLTKCLDGIEDIEKVILAYEPIWAISKQDPNHKAATPQDAQEAHKFIRELLAEKYGDKANETSILYGGSMKPENTNELNSQPDIDGGLIGGASLTVEKFLGTINLNKVKIKDKVSPDN